MFAHLINWFTTLIIGRSPEGLHNFLAGYTRYSVHVTAYGNLLANPFSGFSSNDAYPVTAEIAPPEKQSRLVTFFRSPARDTGVHPADPARPGRPYRLVRMPDHGAHARELRATGSLLALRIAANARAQVDLATLIRDAVHHEWAIIGTLGVRDIDFRPPSSGSASCTRPSPRHWTR